MPAQELAARLRRLRAEFRPGRRLTQDELAAALGVSVPLVSSWESSRQSVVPPDGRLEDLATFYAVQRSTEAGAPRLARADELTEPERGQADALLAELMALRGPVESTTPARAKVSQLRRRSAGDNGVRLPLVYGADTIGGGSWYFRDQRPVTIVCARLPGDMLAQMPYTNPSDADYARLYTLADPDALIELFGHIRAVNPQSQVHFRAVDEVAADDLTDHLVLLGGVDWNDVTRDLADRMKLPVRQQTRLGAAHEHDACFEVEDGQNPQQFRPVLGPPGDRVTLQEDVGYFFRGQNPYNAQRSVTICNGMFGRGTYGAVRALTDARFRDGNEAYVRERFAGKKAFSILARVPIVRGETVTPDWTIPRNRLHEWSEP